MHTCPPGHCCTHSARHGILFPFSLRATLCRFSPNCLHCALQARLCRKCCRHIISLGPYRLSMTSCPMPQWLCRAVLIMISSSFAIRHWLTLYPTPHLPLVATRSIAWSVRIPVTYINPNTLPKELQLSSLGYFPSLQRLPHW